ncbi:aminotransferase class IV [Acetobacter sacchari]|uniref:Probable branched-chain-amino-acid aminotransferase n=1 Tax=Acetobacter sacchari TaxID=2661687 RepID=A0ABS3M0U3_9PROT|nr:aminotransferase class IV [Acetobacter sacchari]MBO1361830.1 aminotransferase class IV [Acetobacter sacchari]
MSGLLWLNGRVLAAPEARIDPADRGFLLGDGLFETIRVAGGVTPHLERHLARLARGCATLMMFPPDFAALRDGVKDLIGASKLRDGSMRLTVTRGPGPRGLEPSAKPSLTTLLTCSPAAPAPLSTPARLHVSRFTRDGTSPLSQVKSLNYLPGVMARLEASAAGYDDALLPGVNGAVAEGSAANVVFLSHGALTTPPLDDGALPGTSRARLLEAGLCTEASLPLSRLKDIEAGWLVSALSLRAIGNIGACQLRQDASIEETLRRFLFS